jgi:glycosyltransferase involved in cell wall biosynthesis
MENGSWNELETAGVCSELLDWIARVRAINMRLILLVHPSSFPSESMSRFAEMIRRGMTARGHTAEFWSSPRKLGRLPLRSRFLRKWLGYFDQFVVYPRELRKQVHRTPLDRVFVVTDQALGMWVPYLAHRPHVIHCHDLLALGSALGSFPENPTSWSGQKYQRLIRNGFAHGKVFISVSGKTRDDLHQVLPRAPRISEVVHNGLNHPFRPMGLKERSSLLSTIVSDNPDDTFIMHIGGNQWYKNRRGVLEIYRSYARHCSRPAALWMVGATPTPQLLDLVKTIPPPGRVRFLPGLSNEQVNAAYAHARALLFPSLEEGFGWPIVEAMAADCPVITTNRAPMTEIAGNAAHIIPRMPREHRELESWAKGAAQILDEVVRMPNEARAALIAQGRRNVMRFDPEKTLSAYEAVYSRALTE